MKSIAKEICRESAYDAVVVGSGPNGLACAIKMLQAGNSVLLIEGQPAIGGGCRTAELTLPGFKHDICSAVHPMGMGSPFFRTLPLSNYGLEWINPEGAYIHAFEPGKGLLIEQDLEATSRNLGKYGDSFGRLMAKLLPNWDELCATLLNPVRLLRYPIPLGKFGLHALMSAEALANRFLVGEESKAAFAGVAAHSSLRLDAPGSASIALALCISAHGVGWPIPKGGAQSVADSLAKLFLDGGGELISDCPVRSLADLPDYRSLFLDITPRQFIKIAEAQLPDRYKKRLQSYRYGPASFKMDWALSAPMPWGSAEFFKAPTVHLAGTLEDIAESERSVWKGSLSPKPYILLAQPTLFDPSRAPEGAHVAWAYCHVPYASDIDASEQIESQIERFAPGFKKNILARSILTPSLMEKKNENLVGGDINGGTLALSQLLTRPIPQLIPYKTPLPNVYLCSSSTPPGSGVHGMCGYYAAWCALH